MRLPQGRRYHLWPLDANSYLPGLLKAQQAGIPVVAIDTKAGEGR
jgi:ABC-type sugar transport system substrate-binding protein